MVTEILGSALFYHIPSCQGRRVGLAFLYSLTKLDRYRTMSSRLCLRWEAVEVVRAHIAQEDLPLGAVLLCCSPAEGAGLYYAGELFAPPQD